MGSGRGNDSGSADESWSGNELFFSFSLAPAATVTSKGCSVGELGELEGDEEAEE
jgi:hypothetical protein